MNKELDRIISNSPDGLKNNPIFKELVEKVIEDKEKENQKWFSFFLLLTSYMICYIMVITLIER